eukprot:gene7105-5111_t
MKARLVVTTVAGNGLKQGVETCYGDACYFNASRRAVDNYLSAPRGVYVDRFDRLYITDSKNNRIVRVLPDGDMETFAGTGDSWSDCCDGTVATSTAISVGVGITGDSAGNIYFSDGDSHRIRSVQENGTIWTLAGVNPGVPGITFDGRSVRKGHLTYPGYLTYREEDHSMYFIESCRLRQFSMSTFVVHTIAGSGECDVTVPATFYANALRMPLTAPKGFFIDARGIAYLPDMYGIWRVYLDGTASLYSDGLMTAQRFAGLTGDSAGDIYLAQTNKNLSHTRILRFDPRLNTTEVYAGGWSGTSDCANALDAQFAVDGIEGIVFGGNNTLLVHRNATPFCNTHLFSND